MATVIDRRYASPGCLLNVVLVASMLPLFLGGLLSDLAYSRTYEIQWSNFAAWLIAGAMVFTGLALLWAIVEVIRSTRDRRSLTYTALLLATFVVGLINSFVHARDAWAVMPAGLVLSAVVTVLAIASIVVGFGDFKREARP